MNIIQNIENYPINLLDEISESEAWEHPLPPDLLPSVEYALATLSERESKVLHMRYQEGLTYDEVAKPFNVTRERIRQIEAKAIRKLRHPIRIYWLIDGISGTITKRVVAAREASIGNEIENAAFEIRKIADMLAEITNNKDFLKIAGEVKKFGCRLDTPVRDLGLSVRSENCLIRAGLKYLQDFQEITLNDLRKVRNLGEKCFNEVVEKVHGRGIMFKGEKENET